MAEEREIGKFGRAITRRQFLRRAGLTGAGLAAAACAPQIVEVEKEVSVDKIVIQEKQVTAVPVIPEYVVKHPISQDPQGLDPNNPMMPSNKEMGYMYNEGLYRLTTNGIEPSLATEMPSSENGGKRWIIPLRKGVTFHNGKSFTAADVKYSLDFIKENGLSTGSLLANVESVTAQDDHTVVIDLTAPDSFLLSALSVCDGPRIVAEGAYDGAPVEKEGVQTALTNEVPGVTTGPYEIIEYSIEERVVLKRYDDYWGWDHSWGGFTENIPKYIVFEVVGDPTVRVSQVIAQAQDWYFLVPVAYEERVNEVPGLRGVSVADPFIQYLAFVGEGIVGWTEQGVHNRKAITACMDRIDINNVVNAGMGSPAFAFWYADDPLVNEKVAEIHTVRSDYDLARKHLELAGNPDGFDAHFVLAEGRGYEIGAGVIAEHCAKIGINLTMESNVSSANWPRVMDNSVDGCYHDAGDSGIWAVEYGRYYPEPFGIAPWHMDDMPQEWLDRFMGAMDAFRTAAPGTKEYEDAARNVQWVNADLCLHVPAVHGARIETSWDYVSGVAPSPTITPMIHGVSVWETPHGPPERPIPA